MAEDKEVKEPTVESEVEVNLDHLEEAEQFSIVRFNTKDSLEKALVSAEMALEFLDQLRSFVLKRTKKNDWTNQSGNPYFGEAGCNRFMAPFKIYEKEVTAWTLDANGQKRMIGEKNVFEGEIRVIFFSGIIGSELLGVEASFEGGSRLDDKFRSKDDILFYFQKAKANWRGRGFRKLLGMENLTWEDLAKVNIKPEDVKQINRVETEKADTEDAKIVWDMLLELNEGNINGAQDQLQALTAFKDYAGARKVASLSQKQLNIVKPKVKKLYQEKFPDKATPETGHDDTEHKASTGFLNSVKALQGKVKDEDFKKLLAEFNVTDPYEIADGNQNKFLIALKKLAEGGKK